jgi:hypothetical protein
MQCSDLVDKCNYNLVSSGIYRSARGQALPIARCSEPQNLVRLENSKI